ncbi:hypothetical protein E1218_16730 [Kribbella turkmenica]|uniref:Uncharacterized protein n=1 Tax=Kribbella turkmenica TaxID=2530375 RepID=A0A4R4X244_9ACTN|nr:hypothetical protein E1218_16730 [Kribbella turkmenica]
MTQEVGGVVGTPVLAAIAATQAVQLTGFHLALSFDVALTLVSVVLVWLGLRPRTTKIDGCRPQPVIDRQRVEMI